MEFEDRIPKLIARYLRGQLTPGEQKELNDWIGKSESNKLFFEESTNEKQLIDELRQFNKKDRTSSLNNTLDKIDPESAARNKSRLVKMKRYLAAACLAVIAGTTFYILNRPSDKSNVAESTVNTNDPYKNDVAPGTDKATLTLANGSTIELDNSANKKIADENGTAVNQQGAQLIYDAGKSPSSNPPTLSYNMLSTPRGGQYNVVLPDGSRVWLNAESSIRFPTAFTGNERSVEITGEVYLEVTQNKSKPFKVSVNGMKVEVLGTHFNINAYLDEAVIKTTLLEGSVKVVNGESLAVIKRGQQAQVFNTASMGRAIKVIDNADINSAIAWKQGLIVFNQADIKEILRQVSRWYDVDVEYKNEIKVPRFYGEIPRTVTLTEVLKIIEINSKLQFTIDGKKIAVKQP